MKETPRNRIIIVMEGGLIHNILSNTDIEFGVIDYDVEGLDDYEIITFSPDASVPDYTAEAFVSVGQAKLDPENTNFIMDQIAQLSC